MNRSTCAAGTRRLTTSRRLSCGSRMPSGPGRNSNHECSWKSSSSLPQQNGTATSFPSCQARSISACRLRRPSRRRRKASGPQRTRTEPSSGRGSGGSIRRGRRLQRDAASPVAAGVSVETSHRRMGPSEVDVESLPNRFLLGNRLSFELGVATQQEIDERHDALHDYDATGNHTHLALSSHASPHPLGTAGPRLYDRFARGHLQNGSLGWSIPWTAHRYRDACRATENDRRHDSHLLRRPARKRQTAVRRVPVAAGLRRRSAGPVSLRRRETSVRRIAQFTATRLKGEMRSVR